MRTQTYRIVKFVWRRFQALPTDAVAPDLQRPGALRIIEPRVPEAPMLPKQEADEDRHAPAVCAGTSGATVCRGCGPAANRARPVKGGGLRTSKGSEGASQALVPSGVERAGPACRADRKRFGRGPVPAVVGEYAADSRVQPRSWGRSPPRMALVGLHLCPTRRPRLGPRSDSIRRHGRPVRRAGGMASPGTSRVRRRVEGGEGVRARRGR